MAKSSIDLSTLQIAERDFPEACKFCLKEDCSKCPFLEERIALEAELLLEAEPTLEKFIKNDERNKYNY